MTSSFMMRRCPLGVGNNRNSRHQTARPVFLCVSTGTSQGPSFLPPPFEPPMTSAHIIDGRRIAKEIKDEVREEVKRIKSNYSVTPGLAVVMVGDRGDSKSYVESKKKACADVGFESYHTTLSGNISEELLLKVVEAYNTDPKVHGILVQLPLPKHIDERRILDAISIDKDIDGFHPANIGCVGMRGREPIFVPCTPKGCIELLTRYKIPLEGKRACVIGRSNIVGLPASLLLQNRDATVTVIHSRTPNAAKICAEADIVIAACGQTEMITAEWIKPGAVVIDVGINPVEVDGVRRLVGDVKFDEVVLKASYITPVPGAVGPMTIAMLMKNTLESAKQAVRNGWAGHVGSGGHWLEGGLLAASGSAHHGGHLHTVNSIVPGLALDKTGHNLHGTMRPLHR